MPKKFCFLFRTHRLFKLYKFEFYRISESLRLRNFADAKIREYFCAVGVLT